MGNSSRLIVVTTENSPASMAENSPTLVKFLARILGRDRCWGSGETEGGDWSFPTPPAPIPTQDQEENKDPGWGRFR